MIEGLKVVVKAADLRELCITRMAALENKQKEFEARLARAGPGGVRDLSYEESLRAAANRARNNVAQLQFIAGHLADDDYLLTTHDLRQLTIIK